jgi:protein-S-isoprenylcysteine O-methyltransferase Ste14
MKESDHSKNIGIQLYMKSVLIFLVFIFVTFLTAGRLDYWQGWVFNILNIFFLVVTFLVLHDRKDVIKERLKPGAGMKRWDRVYYAVSTPLFFVMFIISILDATRFVWGPLVSFMMIILGVFLYCLGQFIVLWAKRTNRFFSSVVRIQHDRNQVVCSEGPYRLVRHPGYLGGIIFTIGTPLLLGSYWGMLPAVLTIPFIVARTYLEDTTLKKELQGYMRYTEQVKYRLFPFLW